MALVALLRLVVLLRVALLRLAPLLRRLVALRRLVVLLLGLVALRMMMLLRVMAVAPEVAAGLLQPRLGCSFLWPWPWPCPLLLLCPPAACLSFEQPEHCLFLVSLLQLLVVLPDSPSQQSYFKDFL